MIRNVIVAQSGGSSPVKNNTLGASVLPACNDLCA